MALFSGSRGYCIGETGRGLEVTVIAWDMAGTGFIWLVCLAGDVSVLLGDPLVLFPLGIKSFVTLSDFIQPFAELYHLVQLLRRDFLCKPGFHTHAELMAQLIIGKMQGSAKE